MKRYMKRYETLLTDKRKFPPLKQPARFDTNNSARRLKSKSCFMSQKPNFMLHWGKDRGISTKVFRLYPVFTDSARKLQKGLIYL